MTHALEIKNVSKIYAAPPKSPTDKEIVAVNDVSFQVEKGEIFGLLGPNGAGKTTLISMISGLIKQTSGDIKVCGHKVGVDSTAAKMSLGVVPQEVVASGFFNLEELLTYHSGYYGISDNKAKIHSLLTRLKLDVHKGKMMRQLSGGMRRRMMIAKALVHSPKLLLLDEPTAGVDVELRNQLWDFVRELQAEGVSIVLTTHYLQEAEELCHRVGIINHGELKFIGPKSEIIQKLTQKKFEMRLRDGSTRNFSLHRDEALGDYLVKEKIRPEEILDVRTQEGTLEEAFVKVVRA